MRARLLVPLELVTGVAGLAGGLLLALAPDGSLLGADPGVLAGSPFTDWRWPGVLLAALVGGGFLVSAGWQGRHGGHARELSMAAGAGLVLFEARDRQERRIWASLKKHLEEPYYGEPLR